MVRRPLSRGSVIAFIAFWGVGCLWFITTYLANPPRPHPADIRPYGTSWAGELKAVLLFTVGEVVVTALILQPWTYDRSWGRAGLTLLILTPWLLLWGALGLHSEPTTYAHTTWLILLWLVLFVLFVRGLSGSSKVKADVPPTTK